jgi:hypothetical protein
MVLYLAFTPFPLFLRGMNAIHVFLSFLGGAVPFCDHYSWTLGVMDVDVDDPRR